MQGNYIVRLSSNKLVCFFNTVDKNICYRMYEQGRWSKTAVLISDAQPDFSVTFSQSRSIYLFCQDSKGSIVLTNFDGDSVTTKVILENQSEVIHSILFYSLNNGASLTLIYNIPSGDKRYKLVSQNLRENGEWEKPVEIDNFLPLPNKIFEVQHLNSHHVLAFYRSEANIAGYREITPEKWGEFTNIQRYAENISSHSFLTTENTIHTLYITTNLFSARVIYRRKESNGFEKPVVLWEGSWVDNCLLTIVNNVLHAFFFSSGNLYVSRSINNGETFSRSEIYRNKFCVNPIKAVYITQNPMDEGNHYSREVYVDSHNPWDIQLLPDICDDFYSFETIASAPTITPVHTPVAAAEAAPEPPRQDLPDLTLIKERMEKLTNENQEQRAQIGKLNQALREKEEIATALITENSKITMSHREETEKIQERINTLEIENNGLMTQLDMLTSPPVKAAEIVEVAEVKPPEENTEPK